MVACLGLGVGLLSVSVLEVGVVARIVLVVGVLAPWTGG